MISFEAFRAEFKTAQAAFDKACEMAEIAQRLGDKQGQRDFTAFAQRIYETERVRSA
jgi:hypothetical protein